MVWTRFDPCALLEISVVLFQIFGIGALCFYRLFPRSRWADHGRAAVILSLFGLGFSGALCGRLDSEFALFAGVTMTVLLIGMTSGSSRSHATESTARLSVAEPALVG
jgi:hypothetical protein